MALRDVIIIGGELAGLSAALYLGRSKRDTLLIHSGRSIAKWEALVQDYLGFPEGIAGTVLLDHGMDQAARYDVEIVEDEIQSVATSGETFHLQGRQGSYDAKRLLIATGLTHLPPDVPGVKECLGKACFSARTAMRTACKVSGSSSSVETMKPRTTRSACCYLLRASC